METLLKLIKNHAVATVVIVMLIIGITYFVCIIVASYPGTFWVNKIYKNPIKDISKFFFYYQKAAAYRMLFIVHSTYFHLIKVLGKVMTFVTLYCVLDSNGYIIFCSLLSAICEGLELVVPAEKYMKIYTQGARILEYELNTIHSNEDDAMEKLKQKYEEAEEVIARDFM